MAAPEAGPVRMLATLGIAGMCSGLALVGIFLATKPRIERNRARALEVAIFQVLRGSVERAAFVPREGRLVPFDGPTGSVPTGEAVYAGYDESGRLLGFAIPAEGPGFQDTIKLIYGYDPARERVVGIQVLESRETPGLGDKIMKDQGFLASFRDLAVSPDIVAVKRGRRRDNEVDAISGATISSVAVVHIINEANARWTADLPAAHAAPEARDGEGVEVRD
jgi:electron transport complex protein RnfG